jgi:hypothetical protein
LVVVSLADARWVTTLSPEAVPIPVVRVLGAGVVTYVSFTTVRSFPRKSPKSKSNTTTATARIPQKPPGKLRVVVSVLVSVAVLVIVPFEVFASADGDAGVVASPVGVLGCVVVGAAV